MIKAGEGQVTINTPLSNVPHNHPRKMKHHTDRFKAMTRKIDGAIRRVLEGKPYGTRIKFSEDEWLINDRGRMI